METKTSEEWAKSLPKELIILDPDGWDRSNWEYSWEQELITQEEFQLRLGSSTLMGPIPTNLE